MPTSPVTVPPPPPPHAPRRPPPAPAAAAGGGFFVYVYNHDIRIAVSELCSLVSLDSAATITLSFLLEPGALVVTGETATGAAAVAPNELSRAIIEAVVDEHTLESDAGVTQFRLTKRAQRGVSAPDPA